MREARVGCQDHSHAHHRLVWMRPVDRDDTPGVDFLLSVWLCPVFHQIGAWAGFPVAGEQVRRKETDDDVEDGEHEGPLRRLLHRD